MGADSGLTMVMILAGDIINENYFIVIRELDEGDDVHDFSLYEKQSPILRSKNAYAKGLLAQIKREHDEAYGKRSVSQIREYLIKRCNLWQVDAEEKYLQSRELEMLRKSVVPVDEVMPMIKDKPCIYGIDASKRIDLTATGCIFNLPDNKVGIYAKGFIPEEAIRLHEKQDRIPYSYYAKEGYIKKIYGQVIDTDVIADHICDFEEENNLEVREVCLDEAFCYQLEIDLTEGRTKNGKTYACVGVPQTTTALNEPTNDFVELLLRGQLVICENPVFMWCCENAYISEDNGGRRKIKKQSKDSPNRIDLLAAVLNALKRRHILEDQTLINLIETGRFSFFG